MTEHKWQVVVFDFFGVICSDLVDEWLHRNGLAEQADLLREQFVRPADLGHTSFAQQCDGLGKPVGLGGREVEAQLLSLATIDLSAVEIVERLGARMTVAICSNAPRGLVDTVLSTQKIDLPCKIKVSSGTIGVIKPDARAYLHVLDACGCPAASAIMIDDRIANVKGAEAVGMTGVHFTTTVKLSQELHSLGILV